MKKILIVFLFTILFGFHFSIVSANPDSLTKIENALLGVDYSNQKTEQRLARLEEFVYGHIKQGPTSQRLKTLSQDVHSDLIGQEIEPVEDTLMETEDVVADNSVNYPVLDDVEKKLAIKSTPTQSLHSRLVNIEKKMFNKVYDTDDFYTRVERIKQDTYGQNEMLAQNNSDDIFVPNTFPDNIDDYFYPDRSNFTTRSLLPNKVNYKLSALEQKVLNNTYPEENNNDRLARLENRVFDTEFYYDDDNARLKRLESAIKAQKTAKKYDNNKLQQHLNAALQIGTMLLMVLACIL